MSTLIELTQDYGYNDFRISQLQSTVIDATDAHWIVSNMGAQINLYPVMVTDSANVTLIGGTISGQVPLDIDRVDAYVNSAGVFVRNTTGAVIEDWKITQAWDGIRVRGSSNFVIENVWMSDIRDDAIENDDGLSGTVRDSLFDGVFVGMSTADDNTPNRTGNVVTFDNVLIRMESSLHRGEVTHLSPFKVTAASPAMKIYDSIIAIEDVDHAGQGRLKTAWEKTVDASGNYFLNLSDDPLPKGYPMPGKGFTVLQGKEARAFWEAAKSEWIAERTDTGPDSEATHLGSEDPDTLKGTVGDDIMIGKGGDDYLTGFEGADLLRGQAGNDILVGRLGADILIGGAGNDTFRLHSAADSAPGKPDIIRAGDGAAAFEGAGAAKVDLIDLTRIDADETANGDQAFTFGSIKRGGISMVDVDGNTVVRGNTDGDAAFEFTLVIEDGKVAASQYTAHDFML